MKGILGLVLVIVALMFGNTDTFLSAFLTGMMGGLGVGLIFIDLFEL